MKWRKLGRLYDAPFLGPKLASHAANPLAVPLGGHRFRIYFSGRDECNRSSVGSVEVDLAHRALVSIEREPAFVHGPAGSFYADGVSIGNCYEAGRCRYVPFMGWQSPAQGHWRGDLGRLRLLDDGSLVLDPQGAFIASDAVDPVSLSYPWVLHDGERYRMWYGSTLAWNAGNGEMLHVLRHAWSDDGHRWHRDGSTLPYEIGVAQAFSRPSVARDGSGWHMWFSYRSGVPGQMYRIGYASSRDGVQWELRLRDSGIDVSAEGWDSQMIEYPFVFDHCGERYMLYNGNGYGRSGFGLAVLEHA